jgi:hypothetical protein
LALLLLAQFSSRHRMTWPALLTGIGCLLLGTGLVFGSYLAVVGVNRPRDVIDRALGRHVPPEPAVSRSAPPATAAAAVWRLENGTPMSFTRRDPSLSMRRHTVLAAVRKSLVDLAAAFNMLIGLFALVGLRQLRRRPMRPVDWLVRTFVVAYILLAVGFAAREGYSSPRHFLVVVVAAIGCAGYGLVQSGAWLASRFAGLAKSATPAREWVYSLAMVVLAVITCLPEDLLPVRAARLGYRQAGQWLARSPVPGMVLDTWGVSSFYSGRKTQLYDDPQAFFGQPDLAYVVLQQRELTFSTNRSRSLRRVLELAAEPAARFADPCAGGKLGESVIIYRWHPEQFQRALAQLVRKQPS